MSATARLQSDCDIQELAVRGTPGSHADTGHRERQYGVVCGPLLPIGRRGCGSASLSRILRWSRFP